MMFDIGYVYAFIYHGRRRSVKIEKETKGSITGYDYSVENYRTFKKSKIAGGVFIKEKVQK